MSNSITGIVIDSLEVALNKEEYVNIDIVIDVDITDSGDNKLLLTPIDFKLRTHGINRHRLTDNQYDKIMRTYKDIIKDEKMSLDVSNVTAEVIEEHYQGLCTAYRQTGILSL